MTGYLDCGEDQARFIEAANAFIPAILTTTKAESVYRLAVNGKGLLIEHLFKLSETEPREMRELLEDKWLALRYEKGRFPVDLVDKISLGLAEAWGPLKDAIDRVVAAV